MGSLRPLAGAAAMALAANIAALRVTPAPYPPPTNLKLEPEEAVASASLVSLGMRRLAADLAFIRLIVYYGSPDRDAREQAEDEGKHGHPHFHNLGGGVYRELGPRALRVLALDPFFNFPPLYVSGALAFNLHRPLEAEDLLTEALHYRPKDWKYVTYLGAIGFQKKGDAGRVLNELVPILRSPDCPTQLKNTAAFMALRLGRRAEAVRLYREILESRDHAYDHIALRQLRLLGERVD